MAFFFVYCGVGRLFNHRKRDKLVSLVLQELTYLLFFHQSILFLFFIIFSPFRYYFLVFVQPQCQTGK